MRLLFSPSSLRGRVTLPASKSLLHRDLIAAALADGESEIVGFSDGDDVLASVDCLGKMGALIAKTHNGYAIRGCGRVKIKDGSRLDCRESGSTLRFLLPLLWQSEATVSLQGSPRLFSRPLSVFQSVAEEQNLLFCKRSDTEIAVGGALRPDKFTLPGDLSSQFASGLLFALPLLHGDSELHFSSPVESLPYLEMTRAVLSVFGVLTRDLPDGGILIPGGQTFRPASVSVEGDRSSASFFQGLNAFPDNRISISGLSEPSLQGDAVFASYLSSLQSSFCVFRVENCPDLAPILAVCASFFHGCKLQGTRRLAFKECDRATAIAEELSKCGALVTVSDNEITVLPGSLHAPDVPLDAHGDHRMAMSLAVLLTRLGGRLDGCESAAKSFPSFFADLRALGAEIADVPAI